MARTELHVSDDRLTALADQGLDTRTIVERVGLTRVTVGIRLRALKYKWTKGRWVR